MFQASLALVRYAKVGVVLEIACSKAWDTNGRGRQPPLPGGSRYQDAADSTLDKRYASEAMEGWLIYVVH